MANRKLSISFKKKYLHVYHYLQQLKDNKENVSDYICKLIEKDISKQHDHLPFEELRKVVYEILQSNSPSLSKPPIQSTSTFNQELSDEDIELLNQLF